MNGTDIISVTPNDTGVERTGTITYTAGDATPVVVTVTQAAQDSLSVDPTTLDFDFTGEPSQTVTVTTSADTFTATPSDSWITIVQSDGSFTVTLDENTGEVRTSSITVNAGTADEVTITVTQASQDLLSVTPPTQTVAYDDQSVCTYIVSANSGSYSATSDADWVTITQSDDSFTVNAISQNTTGTERIATITITSGNADPVTVQFIQSAQATLDVTPTALTFSYEGTETQSVDVSTSGELYTATPSEDWITVTVDPVADTFHVEVDRHEGQDLRTAMITVNDDLENEQAVSVEQLFPPFTHKIEIDLSKEVMRFGPDSTWETQVAEILTAVDYDDLIATSDDNWITCEIVNVSGRYEVKVSCVPNTKDNETGGLERTGYVYVGTLSGNGYPAKLTVIQGKKW